MSRYGGILNGRFTARGGLKRGLTHEACSRRRYATVDVLSSRLTDKEDAIRTVPQTGLRQRWRNVGG